MVVDDGARITAYDACHQAGMSSLKMAICQNRDYTLCCPVYGVAKSFMQTQSSCCSRANQPRIFARIRSFRLNKRLVSL